MVGGRATRRIRVGDGARLRKSADVPGARRSIAARGRAWDNRSVGHGVEVTELFGIGTKYEIACGGGQRLVIVVRKDGARELYAFQDAKDNEPDAVIRLDEEQARRVAAVLGGTYFGE